MAMLGCRVRAAIASLALASSKEGARASPPRAGKELDGHGSGYEGPNRLDNLDLARE